MQKQQQQQHASPLCLLAPLLLLVLLHVAVSSPAAPTLPSLYSSLSSLRFLNNGTTSSATRYGWNFHDVMYGEPENISTVNQWWGQGGAFPFLYQDDGSPITPCSPGELYPGQDMPGGDLTTIVLDSPSASQCQAQCCGHPSCRAFTVTIAPSDFSQCKKGQACCYLKSSTPQHVPSSLPNITSGLVHAATSPFTVTPPSGMRSAVPVGGIAAGSVELRGDGSFHEWTLVNQSPGGAAKYGVVDEAVMAMRVGTAGGQSTARLIRTQPPQQLPGVAALRYQGSYPVGRLDVLDPALPAASVFAYSALRPFDLNRSIVPAFVLSLNAHNPSTATQDVSFMFSLPFGVESDQARPGSPYRNASATSAAECMQQCAQDGKCQSWGWAAGQSMCGLNSDVPLNRYQAGVSSGVNGSWEWDQANSKGSLAPGASASARPLRHGRPGDPAGPSHGDLSLLATISSASSSAFSYTFSLGVGASLSALYKDFADDGQFTSSASGSTAAVHGAVSITASLPPGANATLSIVVAWYFPNRDHVNVNVGNFYAHLFPSSSAAAQSIAGSTGEGLAEVVADVAALHSTFFGTSLPEYLIDSLVNSFSQSRSAMYVRDGKWRQWEAFDCVDVDSIHNDYQRHLPYILYFPETEINKIMQHQVTQEADGMLQEELIGGCGGDTLGWDAKDDGGRHMADVTNLYIAEIYQLWRWLGDEDWMRSLWPSVKKAVQWEVGVSPRGLPEHLVDTYDIVALDQYELCAFNAVLHLLGMKAAMEMARALDDTETLNLATASYSLGQQTMNSSLWYAPGRYYQAYYDPKTPNEHAVFADALYAQVVSNTLGLGDLLPRDQQMAHLEAEEKYNDSPYGLIVQTGREPISNQQDNSIWMGGSQDWTTLAISLGMPPAAAYRQARKGMDNWRLRLADQWNVWGLAGGMGVGMDGLHWTTSHYAFHMVLWHTPFALSGQQWDARNHELTFSPKLSAPFSLPVMLPGLLGRLEVDETGGHKEFRIVVTMGSAVVHRLAVDGAEAARPGHLTAGQTVTWTASAQLHKRAAAQRE